MKLFTCVAILCLNISFVIPERLFFGRRDGGNVIPPPPPPNNVKTIDENFFDQIVDHSNPTNQQTFRQKYFVNDDYFDAEKRNVAFLMVSGESAASPYWMTGGSWIENAEKYRALMFQLEHRYYGESQPFNDTSLEHLKYLTTEQAIDDLGIFIVAMNKKYQLAPDVKWISFGGSYAGALSAWLRLKYPHLVHGAHSSGGPVQAIVNFDEYFRVVADDLRDLHSMECANAVQDGFKLIEDNLGGDTFDLDAIFNLCTPIKDSLDDFNSIGGFFQVIADTIAGVVQYNQASRVHYNIQSICDILTNKTLKTNLVERLADITKIVNGFETCIGYQWTDLIQLMKDDNLNSTPTTSGMRQWFYQTCTELGYFQTSTAEPHVFGTKFPVDLFVNLCNAVYNTSTDLKYFDGMVERTNSIYGAKNIEVSNVIFVHGSADPWHPLGVFESQNVESPAILINGTSHCMDMYDPFSDDPADLLAARKEITKKIGEWLKH